MYFARVIEKDELPTWQRLRTEIYLLEGFIAPDQLNADGLFVDGEDDRSRHIAVFDALGEMVGTFRLIIRTKGRRLPVEKHFGVVTSRRRLSAELSGLAVRHEHRNGLVLLGLLRVMYDLALNHGVHATYAELEKPLLTQLIGLGFPFVKVGDSQIIYNTRNWPTRMFVPDILSGLRAKDLGRKTTAFTPFFVREFDGFVTSECLEIAYSTPIALEGVS